MQLETSTNDGGRVNSAALRGDAVPDGLRRCIETAARSARIRDADTGHASATVELSFSESPGISNAVGE
jgi:hypothetical protein